MVIVEDHVVKWMLLSPMLYGQASIDNLIDEYGRPMIKTRKKSRYMSMARAIALEFLPPPAARSTIETIDGDKYNLKVENLRWLAADEQGTRNITSERQGMYEGVLHVYGKYVPTVFLKCGRQHKIGSFLIAEEAAAAHKSAQFEMGEVSYFR